MSTIQECANRYFEYATKQQAILDEYTALTKDLVTEINAEIRNIYNELNSKHKKEQESFFLVKYFGKQVTNLECQYVRHEYQLRSYFTIGTLRKSNFDNPELLVKIDKLDVYKRCCRNALNALSAPKED